MIYDFDNRKNRLAKPSKKAIFKNVYTREYYLVGEYNKIAVFEVKIKLIFKNSNTEKLLYDGGEFLWYTARRKKIKGYGYIQ